MRMGRDVRHNIETSLRGESRYGGCWEGIGAPQASEPVLEPLAVTCGIAGRSVLQWLSLDITVIHEEI